MKTPRQEKDRENELSEAGFEATGDPCPNCGTFLWETSNPVGDDEDTGELMHEVVQECPSCGYGAVSYDG